MKASRKLNWLGLAIAGGLVTACDNKVEELSSVAQPEAVEEKVVTVYTWEDYFDVETFAGFEEKTGAKVVYKTFESTDEMEAKLLSEPGEYDVIVADDSILDQMAEQRLIQELDHSLLPNLENIKEAYRTADYDPGNKLSAPYTWGTTLIAYRADKIDVEEKSWNLLWDERLKGKVMMYKEAYEVLSIPIIAQGNSLNTSDATHIGAAADRLIEQINKVDVRFASDLEVKECLADGSVWAAMCYSGDAAMAAAENENVKFFIPTEGAPLWVDSFAVTKDTKRKGLAHAFVNYMMDARVAAKNINYVCYASPNGAAEEFIDDELKADESINPPADVLRRCTFFAKKDALREKLLNEAWLRVHTAYRKTKTASTTLAEPE